MQLYAYEERVQAGERPPPSVTVELRSEESTVLLSASLSVSNEMLEASGCSFSPSWDKVVAQTLYGEDNLWILHTLVTPSADIRHGDNVYRAHRVVQVLVPEDFWGRTYGQFFRHMLLNMSSTCLGLFRAPRSRQRALEAMHGPDGVASAGMPLPFVATNPAPTTLLFPNDRVFVLAPRPTSQ